MRIKRVANYPLSIAVFAGRTAWESYARGGKYIVPTDNINKNDYNFLFTLFNNLKHWSVAEHLWYTFEIGFSNENKMYETLSYVKNEYNFFSKIKDRNAVIFSVNLRTILEELNDSYEGSVFIKDFYRLLISHLPGIHRMLIEKEKYDEKKVFEETENSSIETFESVNMENRTGHKVSVLYKQQISGYKFDFERRPHVFYTLFIENFSRAVLQEIIRHDDLLAATVKSSRFTLKELKEEKADVESMKKYVISPENDEIKESQIKSLATIKNLLNKNVKIDKIKYMLPEGYKTKAVLTYNVKNLDNLIKLRTESSTKVLWEFYELAELIRKIKKEV